MLCLKEVHASYGAVAALQGVSFNVPKGSIVTVLGANGAGKTTTMRVASGMLRPSAGSVELDGRRIDGVSPERLVHAGISHVPEGRQVFSDLTVAENLRLGAFVRRDGDGGSDLERVFTYFPVLRERHRQTAGLLSGGEQQMLSIGRALMARPKLLLLDEPSLGLAPKLVREILQVIRQISEEQGLTVLLVEQDANLALDIAQQGIVLETGRVAVCDSAERLRENESVRRVYLGY